MTESRCAICGAKVFRDRNGRIVWHTRLEQGDRIGDKPRAVICEGSRG